MTDSWWPGPGFPEARRKPTLADRAIALNVSFLAPPRTRTDCHFQSSNRPEDRHANDRFQTHCINDPSSVSRDEVPGAVVQGRGRAGGHRRPVERTKKLSANSVHCQLDLAECNDRGGDVIERHEAALELLVSDEQLAEAVEPAMANLDHPAPSLLRWVSSLGSGLLWATDDMKDVAVRFDDLQCPPVAIAGIGTQVLAAPRARGLALDHDGLQREIDLRDLMLVGPGHDERQRDATAVHQEMSLAPPFSPDPSGWVRPPLAPVAP